MSKQQFLVELSQYLTFVSPEDKEKILASYAAMFEEAGDDGAAALEAELGTPMKLTIELKRRKEAGENIVPGAEDEAEAPEGETSAEDSDAVSDTPAEEVPAADTAEEVTAPEEAVEAAPEAAAVEIPAEEAPAAVAPAEPEAEAPTAEVPADAVPAEEIPAVDEIVAKADKLLESEQDLEPLDFIDSEFITDAPAKGAHAAEATGAKRVFKAIGSVLLSIIVCAAFVCVGALGAMLIITMGELVFTGFGIFYRLADGLLTIGIGLVLGAVGILVVWLCVWAAVTLTEKICGWMHNEKEAEEV